MLGISRGCDWEMGGGGAVFKSEYQNAARIYDWLHGTGLRAILDCSSSRLPYRIVSTLTNDRHSFGPSVQAVHQ